MPKVKAKQKDREEASTVIEPMIEAEILNRITEAVVTKLDGKIPGLEKNTLYPYSVVQELVVKLAFTQALLEAERKRFREMVTKG